MNLADLQLALQGRVVKSCGGAEPDPAALTPYLDEARFDLGLHVPVRLVQEFHLGPGDTILELERDGQPAQVVYCEGVYIEERGRGDPFDFPTAPRIPADYFGAAFYRDNYARYTMPVEHYRNANVLTVVKPRFTESLDGVVLYGVVPEWADLDEFQTNLIIDRAQVGFIDHILLTGKGGLVKIPTPTGPFEFDGGRVLLALRDRLMDGFNARVAQRTSTLFHG